MSILAASLRIRVAEVVGEVRREVGWSQDELGRRAGVSQSTICRLEQGAIENLTIGTAARVLDALGIKVTLELKSPLIANGPRQRDAGHARCMAYVVRRLTRLGWIVQTETEVVSGAARGWIDVLAFRPSDGTLLVIEIKTELPDIGAAMRQHAWYEREAWQVARGFDWQPTRRVGAVLVLASAANMDRLRANRDLLTHAFPLTARELMGVVGGQSSLAGKSGIALIDPYERGSRWILASPLERRPTLARYANYADLMRRVDGRRAA